MTGVQTCALPIYDASLPKAPALVKLDGLQNKDGYSTSGQSLPIEDKHVYVIANASADDATKFYYHYIYVTGFTNDLNEKATFKMEVRVANKLDAL